MEALTRPLTAEILTRIQIQDLKEDASGDTKAYMIGPLIDNKEYRDAVRGILKGEYSRHGVSDPDEEVVEKELSNCFDRRMNSTLKRADNQPAVEITYKIEFNLEVATRLRTTMVSKEPLDLYAARKLYNAPKGLILARSGKDLNNMSFEESRDEMEKALSPYLIEGTQRLDAGGPINTSLSILEAVSYGETLLPGVPKKLLDPDFVLRGYTTVEIRARAPAGEPVSEVPGERSETSLLGRDIIFLATMRKDNTLLDVVSVTRLRVRGTEVIYPTSIHRG
jgi:hypothetical protein